MSLETILTIAFLAAAAIIHGFMKKKEEKDADTWLDDVRPGGERKPPTRPAAPRPRPQPSNWEEELRRFLHGEQEQEQRPPPVVRREPPPPPRRPAEPVVVRVPPPSPPPLLVHPPPVQTVSYESGEGPASSLPSLTESVQAFQRASQIETKVEEQLRQVVRHISRHSRLPGERPAPVRLHQALALLQTPQALRTAVVASIVLGPPKAMEP